MNRLRPISPSGGGVVADYLGAGLALERAQKHSPKRKRSYPGFRIRMMDFYVEQIRAVVECTGEGVSQFIYHALLAAMNKTASQIGMCPSDIARLSKHGRAEIRRKYRLAATANRVLMPERN